MWIKRKLREPVILYMLLFFFISVQAAAAMQFYQERDVSLNRQKNDQYLCFYAAQQNAGYWYGLDSANTRNDAALRQWAESGLEVVEYFRTTYMDRYMDDGALRFDGKPVNEDIHILFDLSALYGFDYRAYRVERPEKIIGREKWERLRQYYHSIGTPQSITDRLLPPYDTYLGENAKSAPVLQRNDPGYYFYLQRLLNYTDILLSDFPEMQFHAATPGVLINRLLSNRYLMTAYIVLCIFLTSSLLAEDRTLGTVRLFASAPRGREKYFLSSFGNSLLLAAGGLLASLLPGFLLSAARFGIKGLTYPILCLPYAYRHVKAFPFNRGELADGYGAYTRVRSLLGAPDRYEHMLGNIQLWRLLGLMFLLLFLLTCLMLLIGFIVSTLDKNKNLTAAAAVLPIGLAVFSLHHPAFAAATFPFNPFSAMDVAAVATGMHDFTVLAALLSLVVWNIAALLAALTIIKRRNLG